MVIRNSIFALTLVALINQIGVAGELKGLGEIDAGVVEELPFKASVSIRGGYDSNPTTSSGDTLRFPDGEVVRDPETGETFVDEIQESWFTTASFNFSRDFNFTRSLLELAFTAGITQYWDLTEDEWDPLLRLELNYAYPVSPRFQITANAFVTYQSEPDFLNRNNAVLNGRRNGNYFYSNLRVSGSYSWTPKFSTVTSVNFVAVNYDESTVGNVEDRYEAIVAQEFKYLILPKTSLNLQYRIGFNIFDNDNGRNGIDQTIAAGLTQTFSPRLSGSFRAGVQFRNQDDLNTTSPYGEGTLSYNYTTGSQVSAFVRYGLENSSLVTSSTENETFRIGLSANHRFTGKLQGNASVYYQYSDFSGDFSARTEDTFNVAAGLTYFLTSNLYLAVDYTFSMLDSDVLFGSYDRHRASVGLGAEF